MKGNDVEIDPNMCYWKRQFESAVGILKGKIVKLRNQKKQHLSMQLLTNDLNNMNLITKDKKNLTSSNSDVNKIKIGSLLDLVTQHSPNNEAVWLESCRTVSPIEAKQVIARGLNVIPNSVNLWMKAAELESGNLEKMRVLMKGIESIPNSIRLWKEVVGLANENDAKFLLHRAVECCPLCVEFWMALACLQESIDDAKILLSKARMKLPKERRLKRTCSQLVLTNDMTAAIGVIIAMGVASLKSKDISDTDAVRTANEALVQGDGSAGRWEVIKVLMYNASWKSIVPKAHHSRRRALCKTSLPNSQ